MTGLAGISRGDLLLGVAAVVGVLVALGVAQHFLLRPRYDARVRIGPDGVRVASRLSPAQTAALRAFFLNDFTAPGRLTILIRRRRNRTFEVRFRPQVPPGQRQQVRNFLAVHL